MSFKHTIFLTSANGHIGQELVAELLQDNVKLILPTSNASRLQANLPTSANESNVVVEQGSLGDPQWLEKLFRQHNVDIAYLCLTTTDEFIVSLNFLDAMKRAGTIKHFVYLSACGDYTSEQGYNNVVKNCSAMHVLVKPAIERKIELSDFPWTTTVLGPALFYDNDLRSKNYIMNGYFDEPLGEKGVSRVSTKDIATVACNAMLHPETWAGKKIMIGSKKKYTGSEVAKLWSEAIGKEVKICPSTKEGFDEFESVFFKKSPNPAWARDLRLMYELFAVQSFGPTDEEYETLVECLGREPEDYEEFVRKTGKEWTS
ncbi:hypothetical protein M409DRAFT_17308 [Zasmidium cellare ATCC 36951]|uniref:NmrA-like domain-containing protein n=1 Tax=Zasmidium cellare ATCC 36951 TaxID=1080233 RepID=A0A6A6D329_ZASCE|nr:uncharacterized protein M409DRAFT_17308 [Zasmidium cellare ATCC 36951]KAF2172066.1 hypothetical protein M409DRAFT_17308 [Zasmidium cellare ATCC 36951]